MCTPHGISEIDGIYGEDREDKEFKELRERLSLNSLNSLNSLIYHINQRTISREKALSQEIIFRGG